MNQGAHRGPTRIHLLVAIFALGCGGVDGTGTPAAAGGSGGSAPPASPGSAGTGGSAGAGLAGSGGAGGAAGMGGTGGARAPDAAPVPDVAPPATPGRPRPARLVVLGDSIAACSNIGNDSGPDCSLKKLADYLKERYAPALVYENEAVGAAISTDVSDKQLATVMGRPGHVLVVVYVGGNDLAKYMFALDSAAEQGLNADLPKVLAAWSQIFAHFEDRAKFPDGYTLIMNNQYNPFDDCTAAPYFLSAKKSELLARFNAELARVAREKGAVITDQYTPFLGHGHHFSVRTCPHFKMGAAPFMDDLIHPNRAGHENLFQQWKAVVDGLYR